MLRTLLKVANNHKLSNYFHLFITNNYYNLLIGKNGYDGKVQGREGASVDSEGWGAGWSVGGGGGGRKRQDEKERRSQASLSYCKAPALSKLVFISQWLLTNVNYVKNVWL